jgi:hypothetical protein
MSTFSVFPSKFEFPKKNVKIHEILLDWNWLGSFAMIYGK